MRLNTGWQVAALRMVCEGRKLTKPDDPRLVVAKTGKKDAEHSAQFAAPDCEGSLWRISRAFAYGVLEGPDVLHW